MTVQASQCDLPDAQGDPAVPTRSWVMPLAADVAVVMLFALLGRIAHERADLVAGTLTTAAPFMLGLLAGWLRAPCAGLAAEHRARTVRFGWWLLAWTLGGGMLLRALIGEGLAPAFVLVAAGVLALGLVGRRWALQTLGAARLSRRAPGPRSPGTPPGRRAATTRAESPSTSNRTP